MSDDNEPRFYWCLRHQRVETDERKCASRHLLGPYSTKAEAMSALENVRERNEAWDAEDARWRGTAQ
jgi:hypothetical protein